MATSALGLNDIDAFYGDSHILEKVSFALGEGRLLGLLGRNGAGKSTCMNVVVGLLPARGGSVEVFGADITPACRRNRSRRAASRSSRRAAASSRASPCART